MIYSLLGTSLFCMKDCRARVQKEVKDIMNNYEIIYVIDVACEEEARKALIEKFNGIITANGGEVVKVEEWGKRRLAYAIDYKTEGYYVYVAFNGEATLPKELSRNLGNNENILRSQVVKLLTKKVGIKPKAVPAPAAEEAPAAEAAAEAPAETAQE